MSRGKNNKETARQAPYSAHSPVPEIVPEPSEYNLKLSQRIKRRQRHIFAAFALATASAFLFSMKPIFVKLAYGYEVDATTLMTLRMVFSLPFFVFFGFVAFKQRRAEGLATDLENKTIFYTALTGILGYYAASWCDLEGLSYITAQFERLILFTFPVLVAILNYLIFKTALSKKTLIPMALSYVGLAIIFTHDFKSFGHDVIIGAGLVAAAALFFALYLVLSKPLITKMGSRLFTCIAMSSASVMIIVHFFIQKDTSDLLHLQSEVYIAALAIAIISTVIPAFLVNEAIARLGAQRTSIVGTIGPVFTTIVAVIVLGEIFSIYHAIGMGLVIAGIYLLSTKK